jgi:hypothetical protein
VSNADRFSNILVNTAVAIFRVTEFDAAHPQKLKLYIELQPQKPTDKNHTA